LGDGEDEMTKHYSSWSASGILHTTNTDDVVTLQADFDESGPYTLQFSVNVPDYSPVVVNVNPTAFIDWKVEGNWVHREITLTSGTSISGTAEAVRIQVRDNVAGGGVFEYMVSVQIAKGTRPNIQQPAMFSADSNAAIIPAGTFLDFTIPKTIGVISVFPSTVAFAVGVPVPIPIGTVMGIVIGSLGTTQSFDCTKPFWYPTPVTANVIRVFNANAFDVDVNLTYGIDG